MSPTCAGTCSPPAPVPSAGQHFYDQGSKSALFGGFPSPRICVGCAYVTVRVHLLGAGDVRDVASRLGVRPTKRLGQNFVVEQGTVRQIAALAGPDPGDVVLEVGPGLGSLTLALLEAMANMDARLVAVEIDPALAAGLPRTIADRAPALAGRVDVLAADALAVAELPWSPTVLAANLPYNVAVPVVLHLLAVFPSLARGVVMVQAEVADRMCAGPGSRV